MIARVSPVTKRGPEKGRTEATNAVTFDPGGKRLHHSLAQKESLSPSSWTRSSPHRGLSRSVSVALLGGGPSTSHEERWVAETEENKRKKRETGWRSLEA